MNLLSIALARSIWLGNLNDFNPRGKSIYPLILPFVVEKFKFKKFPLITDTLDQSKGLTFEAGEFKNASNELIAVNLTVYNDGLIADTRSSTNDSDLFLEILLNQLHELLNLIPYNQVIRTKHYMSQLYVSTDKLLDLINPKLKEISLYLSENVLGHGSVNYETGSLSFWPDQIKAINPPPFSFERVIGTPFSEKRFYSASGLQTEKHLELLDKLENILS